MATAQGVSFDQFPKEAQDALQAAWSNGDPWIGSKTSVVARLQGLRRQGVFLPDLTDAHKTAWQQAGGAVDPQSVLPFVPKSGVSWKIGNETDYPAANDPYAKSGGALPPVPASASLKSPGASIELDPNGNVPASASTGSAFRQVLPPTPPRPPQAHVAPRGPLPAPPVSNGYRDPRDYASAQAQAGHAPPVGAQAPPQPGLLSRIGSAIGGAVNRAASNVGQAETIRRQAARQTAQAAGAGATAVGHSLYNEATQPGNLTADVLRSVAPVGLPQIAPPPLMGAGGKPTPSITDLAPGAVASVAPGVVPAWLMEEHYWNHDANGVPLGLKTWAQIKATVSPATMALDAASWLPTADILSGGRLSAAAINAVKGAVGKANVAMQDAGVAATARRTMAATAEARAAQAENFARTGTVTGEARALPATAPETTPSVPFDPNADPDKLIMRAQQLETKARNAMPGRQRDLLSTAQQLRQHAETIRGGQVTPPVETPAAAPTPQAPPPSPPSPAVTEPVGAPGGPVGAVTPANAVPTPQVPTAKEPWEMTKPDAIQAYKQGQINLPVQPGPDAELQRIRWAHRAVVEQALNEGKPVPIEVLGGYPDLAKKVYGDNWRKTLNYVQTGNPDNAAFAPPVSAAAPLQSPVTPQITRAPAATPPAAPTTPAPAPQAAPAPGRPSPQAQQEILRLNNAVGEGETRLRAGVDALGNKLTQPQLDAVQRSIDKAKAKRDTLMPAEAAPSPLQSRLAEVVASLPEPIRSKIDVAGIKEGTFTSPTDEGTGGRYDRKSKTVFVEKGETDPDVILHEVLHNFSEKEHDPAFIQAWSEAYHPQGSPVRGMTALDPMAEENFNSDLTHWLTGQRTELRPGVADVFDRFIGGTKPVEGQGGVPAVQPATVPDQFWVRHKTMGIARLSRAMAEKEGYAYDPTFNAEMEARETAAKAETQAQKAQSDQAVTQFGVKRFRSPEDIHEEMPPDIPAVAQKQPLKPDSYLYHFTDAGNLPSIAERGLAPGVKGSERTMSEEDLANIGQYIYGADNADVLSTVARDGTAPNWTLLRFPKGQMKWMRDPEYEADTPGAWRTKGSVPAQSVEAWDGKEWKPLAAAVQPTEGAKPAATEPARPDAFTPQEVSAYNTFTHYPTNINKQHAEETAAMEAEVRSTLARFGVEGVPPDVQKALDGLVQANRDTYIARSRSRAVNPGTHIVGASNYKGNPAKGEAIERKAIDAYRVAKKRLENTLNRHSPNAAVSSDESDAIGKLKEKVAGLEASQERMKELNVRHRKLGGNDEAMKALLREPDVTDLEKKAILSAIQFSMSKTPFPGYALSNNSAEIRRLKQRIADLETRDQTAPTEMTFDGGRIEENADNNRVQIHFDGKPDEATRAQLRGAGFKWAPSEGAWQRQRTPQALRAAQEITGAKAEVAPVEKASAPAPITEAAPAKPAAAIPRKIPTAADGVVMWPRKDLHLDAPRLQYKREGIGKRGASSQLSHVKVYNEDLGALYHVWYDPEADKVFFVNGHHRAVKMEDLEAEGGAAAASLPDKVPVRFLDLKTAAECKIQGAIINIADNNGTALDAANVFRETGITPEDLRAKGVPLTGKIASEGLALASLHPAVWGMVNRGQMTLSRAIALGKGDLTHAEQWGVMEQIQKGEKQGKKVKDEQVADMVAHSRLAPMVTSDGGDQPILWGDQDLSRSTALERSELVGGIREKIGHVKFAFGNVAKNAEELASAGAGAIDTEKANAIKDEAARVQTVYNQLVHSAGPISDLLNEGALRVAKGEPASRVEADLYPRIKEAVSEIIAGGQVPGAGSGAAGVGRPQGPSLLEGLGSLLSDEAGSVNLGTQRGILGEIPFAEQDVVPAIETAARTIAESADDLSQVFAAASRGKIAKTMAGMTRAKASDLALRTDRAHAALRTAAKAFDKMKEPARLDFIDRMEKGKGQPTADLDTIAKTLREILDSRRDRVIALGTGKLENWIENYFPHVWEEPGAVQTFLRQIRGKRPFQGKASFLRQRTIPTTADGIAAGLKPVSTNPVDLALLKAYEMDRYLMAHELHGDMKTVGLSKFYRSPKDAPEDWEKLDDRMFAVTYPTDKGETVLAGHWYAPAPAARVLNNYLSPGLRKYAGVRAYMGASNLLNMAQLGWSLFHAGFTSMDTFISKIGLGLEQLAAGKPLAAVKSVASSPAAPIATMLRGSKVLREWYDPGSSPEMAEIVKLMTQGGGRAGLDPVYDVQVAEKMREAFRTGNYPGALLRVLPALTQKVSEITTKGIVPRMKAGVFADLAQHELDRLNAHYPQGVPPDVLRHAMGDVWDSVDNRLGQLVYDNLFWYKTGKDMGMMMTRSLGWNLGSAREIGGGLLDVPLRQFHREEWQSRMSHRTAYVLAMVFGAGVVGAIVNYLYTGEPPKSLEDYYFPRTGRDDSSGNPERLSLPGYMKDVFAWGEQGGKTAQHKLAPILSLVADQLRNEDYQGTEIADPDAPLADQLKQRAKAVGKEATPFAVQGLQQARQNDDPLLQKVLPFVGVTKAPKYLSMTPAQKTMQDIFVSHLPQGARKQVDKDLSDLRSAAKRDYRTGNPDAGLAVIQKMAAEGLISKESAEGVAKAGLKAPLAAMFSGRDVTIPEKLKVMVAANPEELKALFVSFVRTFQTKELEATEPGKLFLYRLPPAARERFIATFSDPAWSNPQGMTDADARRLRQVYLSTWKAGQNAYRTNVEASQVATTP